MIKKIFVFLGVSVLLTLLLAGCILADETGREKFPDPGLDFADGWVKIEFLDESRNWVEAPAPANTNWGQVTELPEMPIRKGAEYRISFDRSLVTGRFLNRYTVARRGDPGWEDADVIYEEDPEITWVDWTITYKGVTLTAAQCIENLPVNLYANEFFIALREDLKNEIGRSGPPFLSTAIAPDIISGSGMAAIINSNDPFDIFSKAVCTMTYTVRFTYTCQYRNYQHREDAELRMIEKTVDKTFTIEVVP